MTTESNAVHLPANARYITIVDSMKVQRLRRWPGIEPAMSECSVFAGEAKDHDMARESS